MAAERLPDPERLSVVEQRLDSIKEDVAHKFAGAKADLLDKAGEIEKATKLALATVEKATALAQATAERAVARAEAAATRELLEASIKAVENRFDEQMNAQHRALLVAMQVQKDASEKAERAHEKRFENVNEFRATLADQQKTFATTAECNLRFAGIKEQYDELLGWRRIVDAWRAEMSGKSVGMAAVITTVFAAAGFLAAIVVAANAFFGNK